MRILILETDGAAHAARDALQAVPGVELVCAPSAAELAALAQPGDLTLVGAAQLAALDTLRTQVAKAAGHDLRSPLHAISMGVSLLAGDPPTPEQAGVLKRIDNAIDRISDNLDKLSELSG